MTNNTGITDTVRTALREDIGSGDITSLLIDEAKISKAIIISRQDAVICGLEWAVEVFRQLDKRVKLHWHVKDGDKASANQILCNLEGPARALLAGERTALNFLQTLSGTATRTARYVAAIQGTHAKILDTRKTIPGLRHAQKYAVRCGGGMNHRMGLYDAILIKENHIEAAGSLENAIARSQQARAGVPVEVEVETLDQLRRALAAGVKRILLDNMSIEQLSQAVAITGGRAGLEASGGVNLNNVRSIAQTGVDYISVGDLTKDIEAVDLSMRFEH
ncbi:MAG: carboxylating nicotinate-nucleotide diphosphorylase [Gammaproteobacteria bacterium]|nr:carboxylating nicotinate-nucleotide diphosphorylase [Gammaproteobacteria bacterium]